MVKQMIKKLRHIQDRIQTEFDITDETKEAYNSIQEAIESLECAIELGDVI